ncbi:Uncharacterised protein [Mycobacteroides abscessus subsp. abscessus]|nr:Uncharacterised protein [Mycobacteroides abscessus subsp. abscessus]
MSVPVGVVEPWPFSTVNANAVEPLRRDMTAVVEGATA